MVKKAQSWRAFLVLLLAAVSGCGAGAPIAERFALKHTYSVQDPEFRRTMDSLWGPAIVDGNSIETFIDAREIYPAMLETIRTAQRSITFEVHTFWAGRVADDFVAALSERARAGVSTHLLIDDVASRKIDGADVKTMQDAGVHLARYNPAVKVLLVFTAGEVNHRTHRKLLIVDGHTGFIGGVGIADLWLGEDGGQPWRDTMYRVRGPIVAQLQAAFMDNWTETAGELLHGDHYFPTLEDAGEVECQMVRCSPGNGEADMELMLLLAINAAAVSIDIATPYFLPDDLLMRALRDAAGRGVKVRVIVPGPHLDQKLVRPASQALWDNLLAAGIEIYEYQPGMYHCKVLVIDSVWTSIGSANFDPRSLRLSDEANLNVYDPAFAEQQQQMLEEDIAKSKRITEAKHERRSIFDRIGEFFASPLKSQL